MRIYRQRYIFVLRAFSAGRKFFVGMLYAFLSFYSIMFGIKYKKLRKLTTADVVCACLKENVYQNWSILHFSNVLARLFYKLIF